jgi:rhamnogalacturonyl hydrolase YesR
LRQGLSSIFPLNWIAIQAGKHVGSSKLRQALQVPSSKNPKALALFISGYCDLARGGEDTRSQLQYLKTELARLCSPGEVNLCWGYDWPFVSLRGPQMPAFSPNAIATVAAGEALLDLWEVAGDNHALDMAKSAGKFILTRLNRPVDLPEQLCFSYTPSNQTRIFNSSTLCCAFLARLGRATDSDEYFALARRGFHYLATKQQDDGSWHYGDERRQRWIDSFHTGFNLRALLSYESVTGDHSFTHVLEKGYNLYLNSFFRADGAPKYYLNSVYPIDIHSCSQALLLLSDLSQRDPAARNLAHEVLHWTEANMQSPEGFFYYQRHRWWTNQVPYMRWAQAWMFRALAHVEGKLTNAD